MGSGTRAKRRTPTLLAFWRQNALAASAARGTSDRAATANRFGRAGDRATRARMLGLGCISRCVGVSALCVCVTCVREDRRHTAFAHTVRGVTSDGHHHGRGSRPAAHVRVHHRRQRGRGVAPRGVQDADKAAPPLPRRRDASASPATPLIAASCPDSVPASGHTAGTRPRTARAASASAPARPARPARCCECKPLFPQGTAGLPSSGGGVPSSVHRWRLEDRNNK